jgi:RNA polymerase sigma-70 factor (ECF subfamily)
MTVHPMLHIAHDPQAFEIFYRANVESVQRFITRRVSDPHLAADLTADVFLAAIDSAPRYRPELGSERAWLYGVARNVVASEHRRAAREQHALARVHGRRLLDEDDVERMQQRIDASREARALYAALLQLPDGERAVLELVALDDLTITEAAAALGLRAVTARVRLHRARTGLRAARVAAPAAALLTSTETT